MPKRRSSLIPMSQLRARIQYRTRDPVPELLLSKYLRVRFRAVAPPVKLPRIDPADITSTKRRFSSQGR